ncbi:MAG: DUF2330 domain-containing protein [Phycisphaerales bacterium JB060]
MFRRCIIGILATFLVSQALGDGRTFPMVADPLVDTASSAMPRQRAIIAWDGTEQRLAIDTAFTGEGTEFAWLVPLPSEPEILPATKGMFDTAAVLTAPEIKDASGQGWLIALGVAVLLIVLTAMSGKGGLARAIGLALFIFITTALLLPALGKARGSAGGPAAVQILDQSTAGIYDTTVLKADQAADLLAWLTSHGFGVPAGVEPVVQDYLDKGWCFAAAKLSVDASGDGEHRAHPLQFRFNVAEPIYPMALTAVGNEDIELELFVLADGSARADHMRVACSLKAEIDQAGPDHDRRLWDVRGRPVPLAHPGLVEIAGELPVLTRLHAVLSPARQADDMPIEIVPFRERDPAMYTPGARWGLAINIGLGVAIVGGIVVLVVRLAVAHGDATAGPGTFEALGGVALMGVAATCVAALAVPVYMGEIVSQRTPLTTEVILSSTGRYLAEYAQSENAHTEADVRGLLPAMAPWDDWEEIGEGDSPLHYRLEPGDTENSLWFIWHDAIGGEHRSEIPLKVKPEPDPEPESR